MALSHLRCSSAIKLASDFRKDNTSISSDCSNRAIPPSPILASGFVVDGSASSEPIMVGTGRDKHAQDTLTQSATPHSTVSARRVADLSRCSVGFRVLELIPRGSVEVNTAFARSDPSREASTVPPPVCENRRPHGSSRDSSDGCSHNERCFQQWTGRRAAGKNNRDIFRGPRRATSCQQQCRFESNVNINTSLRPLASSILRGSREREEQG